MNRNAVITGVLLIVVFAVGFISGRATSPTAAGFIEASTQIGNAIVPTNGAANNTPSTATQEGGTTVDTSNLSDGQRKMLQALGIDADNITITPEMVACAEAKLGAARVAEIKNGATPSFSEGATLMACYR